MKKKLWLVAVGSLAAVLVGVSAASAGHRMAPMKFSAALNIKQEVPKEKGAPANASGSFTAVVTGTTLKWTLKFSHLSGAAAAAHIHMAAAGKAGPVLVALCGPCKSGQTGTVKITAAQMKGLSGSDTYVNVHTAKNPNGEIRGQIM